MGSNNKSYRIRTTVGREADSFLDVHLDQDYDSLEILSLKISDKDVYRLHNSDYGVIVGRVLANGNFGVPNAKISVFIEADEQNSDLKMWNLYPYTSTSTKNDDDIRYNLLPDESVKDCHKAVGTFPHKTFLLENDSLLEVFDKYYVYTTRTNAAGDYLICGVPTGMQTLHMDLDLSDCGILSQRPRDFVYKGYTIEQFENPNQFKKDENIDGLSQIFSQNQPVYVKPFWGNEDNGEEIGITRADIEISFKFEPTCVFMGSAISDNASNGVGKKCVPTNQMGVMDELTAGEGTIEMIRKTPAGNVEEFSIRGNQLIDGNGVWCYQIPMNLDYMMTDEYGNMVPTDDPEKGIPTRTRVRFRASLTDMENSSQSYYRAKYLIPNNPGIDDNKVDYNFGTYTEEDSYRDLFWNGVYTVKSYIPRFQKSKRWRNERFSGIKACNYYGGNNPMPYNNLRIKLPFMFTVLCIFVKLFIKIVSLVNRLEAGLVRTVITLLDMLVLPLKALGYGLYASLVLIPVGKALVSAANALVSKVVSGTINKFGLHCTFIGDGLCPDMEGWYFAPGCASGIRGKNASVKSTMMENTLYAALGNGDAPDEVEKGSRDTMKSTDYTDETSIDVQNTSSSEEDIVCLTTDVDYLLNCFEMNLAQEYRVIKFDFYNDWVNGVIYFPRWMRKIKRKKRYKFSLKRGTDFITTYYKNKVQGCMNSENSRVKKSRYYTQQCSIGYSSNRPNTPWTDVMTEISCYGKYKTNSKKFKVFPSKCHKKRGMQQSSIFGKKSGLVTEETTMLGQNVYYLKPCEWKDSNYGRQRTLLFATDIVLLGTLNDCDENGLPQAFKYLNNSSYIMPTNLALTTMDDDAYIYTSGDNTVCSSTKNGTKKSTESNVRRVTPGYESTYSAYSKTDGDVIKYGENDDPIPVTEAAGINWNYSGPGQDIVGANKPENPIDFIRRMFTNDKRYHYLYYPGGHFLGLSCINSETNIKSCVNLKRICELGATMSQRREEMRGYTAEGAPKYRYYVPTGLISNVDIEGAAFRTMFATLNHNKLIATLRSESTGYKKYDFRFLRPDGFDGALTNYVHKNNSPYNRKQGDDTVESNVSDATGFFEKVFSGVWTRPDDYDEKEVQYTETRTVEDSVDDYYMFRFGLDTFADKEQKKHYLRHTSGMHSMPQYENSFYFYFGLKDGATALDEFKKQFFSECESNNIMKAPILSITENINKETLEGSATLHIDNMLPNYQITITDNSIKTSASTTSDSESVDIGSTINPVTGEVIIGHEYAITVVDSIDQTATITHTFGATAVKTDISAINFRVCASAGTVNRDTIGLSGTKYGGFIKIGDEISILKNVKNISRQEDGISLEVRGNGVTIPINFASPNYTDASNEVWYIAYVPRVGTYDVYITYGGRPVLIYSVVMEDNSSINLHVACDYLSYKPEKNINYDSSEPGSQQFLPSRVLSGITEAEWLNGTPFRGATWDKWLMRHTFYRQTEDDNASFDSYIYPSGEYDVAIFGQPEQGGLTNDGKVLTTQDGRSLFYKADFDSYEGYAIDEGYSYITTMFWNVDEHKESASTDNVYRRPFGAMAYSEDGRAAADASPVTITEYEYDVNTNKIKLRYSGYDNRLVVGKGCIVVFENGIIVFPVVTATGVMEAFYSYDIYPDNSANEVLLSMASVYPTLTVPTFYKPMYGELSAITWNTQTASLGSNSNNETVVVLENSPIAYKTQGKIVNGLTFNGLFYSGDTVEDSEQMIYQTFVMDKTDAKFYQELTADTAHDYEPMKYHEFYISNTEPNEDSDNFDQIIYGVKENIPASATTAYTIPLNVYTGRYEGGFDQTYLTDELTVSDAFYEKLQIKIFNESQELNGQTTLYTTERELNGLDFYITKENIFKPVNYDNLPLPVPFYVRESRGNYFVRAYYNHNAKYDKKGSLVPLTYKSIGLRGYFSYPITESDGETTIETLSNILPVPTLVSYDTLFDDGVTLCPEYEIASDNVMSRIPDIVKNGQSTPITISNKKHVGTIFGPQGSLDKISNYNALIAVYSKPDDGTRNKMLVYRVYSLQSFDVLYPNTPNGIEAYLEPSANNTATCDAQTFPITVATNVDYIVTVTCLTGGSDWATLQGSTGRTARDKVVNIKLLKNSEATATRDFRVDFESVNEYPSPSDPETLDKIRASITVTQLNNMQQEIDDLTPPDNPGGSGV